MATSQRTLDQVKSILGKLDRNIDALRERRLGDPVLPVPAPRVSPAPVPGFAPAPNYNDLLIGKSATVTAVPAPLAAPVPAPKSPYGRAQPIRPADHGRA